MSFWRAAGLNYVQYSNIAARCVRAALRKELQVTISFISILLSYLLSFPSYLLTFLYSVVTYLLFLFTNSPFFPPYLPIHPYFLIFIFWPFSFPLFNLFLSPSPFCEPLYLPLISLYLTLLPAVPLSLPSSIPIPLATFYLHFFWPIYYSPFSFATQALYYYSFFFFVSSPFYSFFL